MRKFPKNRLLVLWAGRRRRNDWETLIDAYRTRIRRQVAIDDVTVRAGGGSSAAEASRLEAEGRQLLAAVPAGSRLVALDSRGTARSSDRLAAWLGRRLESDRTLAFVLGSDLGLSPAVRARADEVISFGPMTLPHEMARLVLYEQVFRCLSILGGMKYHRQPLQG